MFSLSTYIQKWSQNGVGCDEWAEKRFFGQEAGSFTKSQGGVLKSGWRTVSSWLLLCLESKAHASLSSLLFSASESLSAAQEILQEPA